MKNLIKKTLITASILLGLNAFGQNISYDILKKDSSQLKILFKDKQDSLLTLNARDYNKDGKADLVVFDYYGELNKGHEDLFWSKGKKISSIFTGCKTGKHLEKAYSKPSDSNCEGFDSIVGYTTYNDTNYYEEKKEPKDTGLYNFPKSQYYIEDKTPDFKFRYFPKGKLTISNIFEAVNKLHNSKEIKKEDLEKLYEVLENHRKEYNSIYYKE